MDRIVRTSAFAEERSEGSRSFRDHADEKVEQLPDSLGFLETGFSEEEMVQIADEQFDRQPDQ